MHLDEIFDSKYSLVLADQEISVIVKHSLKAEGFWPIIVYKAVEDPLQIFIIASKDGAWEVHHTIAEPGKVFISGKILQGDRPANPKFISTAIDLYQTKLKKAQAIRVVGIPEMWPTYEKVIRRFAYSGRYEVSSITDIVRNGITMQSQEIHPKTKFESLGQTIVPRGKIK